MKRKLLVSSLTVLLCFCALSKTTSATAWTPGVAKGDFIYYEMYGVFKSNKPNATVDVPAFEGNNTEWVKVEFTMVSGTVISHVYTMHFKNGTETKINGQTDIDPAKSWNLKFSEKGIPICAANLNVGDPVSTTQLNITETLNRTYESGVRETNLATWNTTDDWGHCYFDKQTGILLELNRTHVYANPATGDIVEKTDFIKLTSSSLWGNTEFPTKTLMYIFISAATIFFAVAIFSYKKIAKKGNEKKKSSASTKLHKNHFSR